MAELIKDVIGFGGHIIYDKSKSDGIPRKLLDNGRINRLGWKPRISFGEGIRQTYLWYREHVAALVTP